MWSAFFKTAAKKSSTEVPVQMWQSTYEIFMYAHYLIEYLPLINNLSLIN